MPWSTLDIVDIAERADAELAWLDRIGPGVVVFTFVDLFERFHLRLGAAGYMLASN